MTEKETVNIPLVTTLLPNIKWTTGENDRIFKKNNIRALLVPVKILTTSFKIKAIKFLHNARKNTLIIVWITLKVR